MEDYSFILKSFKNIAQNKFYQIARNKPIKKIRVKVSTNIPGVKYTQRKVVIGTGVYSSLKHYFLTSSFQYIAIENIN